MMRNVNVALGDRIVLHDINLTIQAGEHVAILGANGCGKSTLIRTMNCELYPAIPDPGHPAPKFASSAAAAGTSPSSATLRSRLRLPPGLYSTSRAPDTAGSATGRTTGLNAVIAGFFSASTPLAQPHRHRRNAPPRRRSPRTHPRHPSRQPAIGEMSAGEKRRILIARALVHRPTPAPPRRAQQRPRPSRPAQPPRKHAQPHAPTEGSPSTGLILVTHHLRRHPTRDRASHPHAKRPHRSRRPPHRTPNRPSPKQVIRHRSKNRPTRRLAP
jgi:iron complex transport system ATP-binding protein